MKLTKRTRYAIIAAIIIFSFGAAPAHAWDDCPHGEVNDEYPGECAKYIDTDGDRIQPAPEDREDAAAENIEITESVEVEDAEDSMDDSTDSQISASAGDSEFGSSRSGSNGNSGSSNGQSQHGKSRYNFALPFFFSLIPYVFSWFVAKKQLIKKFTPPMHNAIWNTVLLVTLVPSAIFGIYMVLKFSFPEIKIEGFDFLYWHVEGSIVMGTVAILHLIQRLTQYLAQVKAVGRGFSGRHL